MTISWEELCLYLWPSVEKSWYFSCGHQSRRDATLSSPSRLDRSCEFTHIVPVSHSCWKDSVYGWLAKRKFKTGFVFVFVFLENCATLFWFLKPLMVLGAIDLSFRIGLIGTAAWRCVSVRIILRSTCLSPSCLFLMLHSHHQGDGQWWKPLHIMFH